MINCSYSNLDFYNFPTVEEIESMCALLDTHAYAAANNSSRSDDPITRMGTLLDSHAYSATSDVHLQDRKWTAPELVELYSSRQTKTSYAEIAKSIKSHSAVDCEITFAKFSNESKGATLRQKWTADQIELLKILANSKDKKADYELIGQMLNHTPRSCKTKAYELKRTSRAQVRK